ncbi:MAG: phosphoadenylyl-sulfate reductase [Nitrospira sp.]|nr:phosphoadenylyl-sulfate reductase [Nitrospira sp.]
MTKTVQEDFSAETLRELNERFASRSPEEILAYAFERFFPEVVLACSFGAEDMVLWDMMHRINPQASLFYLDTDFLFPETHAVRDRLIDRYKVPAEQVIRVAPALTPVEQAKQFGDLLWVRQPDECCRIRKVDPLIRTLKNYSAWVTGIRRDQSPTRATAGLIEWDTTFGLVKVNPLAAWTNDQVWSYIKEHDVPYNALHDQHYPSIGCTHCTAPVQPGDDPRSGRWQTLDKTECGLHQ